MTNIKGIKKKGQVRDIVEAVVVALVLALVIRVFFLQAFKIPSGSMEDTLLIGDHIIVCKFCYGIQAPVMDRTRPLGLDIPFIDTTLVNTWGSVKRGDIIVFRYPVDRSKDFIKRTIALAGDTVELRNKVIYINGQIMEDPHGVHKGAMYGDFSPQNSDFGPYVVPPGHVFAMGDNRERSYDSRFWGPVPIKDIKGKSLIIYWSWSRDDSSIRFSRFGRLTR